MTSFLILATDKTKRDEYISSLCQQKAINPFDQTTLTQETSIKQNTQSIGIEDIKLMQKKIFLKPIKSAVKAIIIEDAQLLTTEAQNALLKILEEPPEHTLIILSSETKETLLPTILSRCTIIQLEEKKLTFSDKERLALQGFLDELPKSGVGEKLKKAEFLAKEKDKALTWITHLILILRERMIQSENPAPQAEQITKLQKLHTLLKTTNVNTRLAIENTLLSINY